MEIITVLLSLEKQLLLIFYNSIHLNQGCDV